MVNRSIQQKILKMKRRNRYVVLSGAVSKSAVRIDRGRYEGVKTVKDANGDEDQVPTGKHVTIMVGKISLSKAVINTGRGPDKERMQTYYERVRSFGQEIPETKTPRPPQELMRGARPECHINYLDDDMARLDLFFNAREWFWVEVDHRRKRWRRSAVYKSKKMAEAFLESDSIRWVEVIDSPPKSAAPSE